MNQKQIGIIIAIIGILLVVFVYMNKVREDQYIKEIMKQSNGSCFLEDGTCLHADRTFTIYIIGGSLAASMVILGIYLIFFDRTQTVLAEHQVKISSALKEATKKDEFTAFLSGFNKDEQEVIRAVKEQEGIHQSTLRYKTGMSKTSLSLTLQSLEERDIIKRKASGKTNEVYLRKKF